jgi:hypothetical protein
MTRQRTFRPAFAASMTLSVLSMVVAGCDAPQDPAPGAEVDVWVSAPHSGDQALILEFDSPVEWFRPAPGFRAFASPGRAPVSFILVADEPLPGGGVRVGTVAGAGEGSPSGARIVSAARGDRVPRDAVDGYAVTLLSP